VSLRIACDLDGTLADMDAALQREAQRLFGEEVQLRGPAARRLESAEDVEGRLRDDASRAGSPVPLAPQPRVLTREELKQLWGHVAETENFWVSLGEIEPGAVARLGSLATRLQWEVLFLTQRPPSAGETAQLQSQRWLQRLGFEFPSVYVMAGSRGRVAKALAIDVVLDDRPENCLDVVADSAAVPVLIWRHDPREVPASLASTRIQPAFSMGEALDRLERTTAERRSRRTLLGRMRSAIGL
jgi:hypothetical protein